MRTPFALPCLLVAAACAGPAPVCRVGAECASGVCRRDGTCEPLGADAGAFDGGALDDGGLSDAGAGDGGQPDGGAPDAGDGGQSVTCLPNHDGLVARDEVFTQAGLRATFRVSLATTWDTAGAAQSDGGRAWSMSGALTGDQSVLVETLPLAGQWFEADYPGASYVAPMGQGGTTLGVFKSQADGLYLMGLASPTSVAPMTELFYTPPAKVLAFPLSATSSWATTPTVTGTYQGVWINPLTWVQTDEYTCAVDRAGTLATPYADFEVLRVRTVLTRRVNTLTTLTLRSFAFVTECFGTVATVTSQDNEPATDFTQPKEVRRLAP